MYGTTIVYVELDAKGRWVDSEDAVVWDALTEATFAKWGESVKLVRGRARFNPTGSADLRAEVGQWLSANVDPVARAAVGEARSGA